MVLCNRARVLEYMRRAGIDAIVATSPVNVTYFTGYYNWLAGQFKDFMVRPGGNGDLLPAFGLYPAAGAPALVVDAALAVNAMDIEGLELRPVGGAMLDRAGGTVDLAGRQREVYELLDAAPLAQTAVQALVALLQARGLARGRVGLEMEGMAADVLAEVRDALPEVEFAECANLIRLVRMVKTEEEIARMARAAALGEDAAARALATARPGRSLRELGQIFRSEVAAQGADLDHFAYGIKGMGLATETDYVPDAGDLMYIDYGCVYRNYCSDSGLTLALGPLSEVWAHRYEALCACLAAGRRAMVPGAHSSAVPAAMWAALEECGIAVSFPHGHGVGLEVRDYPILVADTGLRIRDDCVDEPADLPLEENMVLNMEAMVFALGEASVHIEQSFVVGAAGAEPLVEQDRSSPFIPA